MCDVCDACGVGMCLVCVCRYVCVGNVCVRYVCVGNVCEVCVRCVV